jgi:CHAD domain-containing protein
MPDVSAPSSISPRAVQLSTPPAPTWREHVLAHADKWIGRCVAAATGDDADAAPPLGPRDVKHLRTGIRRLRAVVDLALAPADADAAEGIDRRLARLARRLGVIRDLDVALGLLSQRREASSSDLERAALDELCGELARARTKAVARATKRLRGDAVAIAMSEARAALALHLDADAAERARQWWSMHAPMLSLPDADGERDLEILHAARATARRIRYALELLGGHAPHRATTQLGQVRALQDAIGAHRDHALLVQRLEARIARARDRHRIALLRGLEASAIAMSGPRTECSRRVREVLTAARASMPAALAAPPQA